MKFNILAATIAVSLLPFYSFSQEQPSSAPWYVQKFTVSGGFFRASNTTDVRVGSNAYNMDAAVNFEKDLGFTPKTNTFMGGLQWRPSSRSRFDFSYYGINRSSAYTLQENVTFGDHTYAVNAKVDAYFNTDIYRLSYGYAFLSRPDFEVGFSVGGHIVRGRVGVGLAANGMEGTINDSFNFAAPLPDVGLWGGYTLGNRWAINGEVEYFALTFKKVSGRILGFNAALTYKALDNLNLSAGYTGLNFKVDALRSNLNGHLKWGYNGPSVAAKLAFGGKNWN